MGETDAALRPRLAPLLINGGRAYALAFEIFCEENIGRVLSLGDTLAGTRMILFNPDAVVSQAHVITAVDYALTSFRLSRNIAKSFHVEAFLYAAASREISKALEIFQPDVNGQRAVVVLVAERAEVCIEAAAALRDSAKARVSPIERNDTAALLLVNKLGIKEKEIQATHSNDLVSAVEKCILTRMALEFLTR